MIGCVVFVIPSKEDEDEDNAEEVCAGEEEEEERGGVWRNVAATTPGKQLAGAWVALGNKWNLGVSAGGSTTPKRRSPTRAAATPGGAKCYYTAV